VKPRHSQSTEEIKRLIKSKIDPVNTKIGIRTFKSLKNGNFLDAADSKEEIETASSQIGDICGEQLEINLQKGRNTRLIIYNLPDAVTLENAEDIMLAKNTALKLPNGTSKPSSSSKPKETQGTY